MITLLVLLCVTGTTDKNECDIKPVAQGFANEKQCQVFAPLMIDGYRIHNPGYEVKYVWCVPNPEYLMNRFKA